MISWNDEIDPNVEYELLWIKSTLNCKYNLRGKTISMYFMSTYKNANFFYYFFIKMSCNCVNSL